ncbi:hypothetical protein HKX48_002640 [Thoreauomyces humboldtii]|nr:hypothetical protein HKX48_002640 [Thoreauomyces humboldtii]
MPTWPVVPTANGARKHPQGVPRPWVMEEPTTSEEEPGSIHVSEEEDNGNPSGDTVVSRLQASALDTMQNENDNQILDDEADVVPSAEPNNNSHQSHSVSRFIPPSPGTSPDAGSRTLLEVDAEAEADSRRSLFACIPRSTRASLSLSGDATEQIDLLDPSNYPTAASMIGLAHLQLACGWDNPSLVYRRPPDAYSRPEEASPVIKEVPRSLDIQRLPTSTRNETVSTPHADVQGVALSAAPSDVGVPDMAMDIDVDMNIGKNMDVNVKNMNMNIGKAVHKDIGKDVEAAIIIISSDEEMEDLVGVVPPKVSAPLDVISTIAPATSKPTVVDTGSVAADRSGPTFLPFMTAMPSAPAAPAATNQTGAADFSADCNSSRTNRTSVDPQPETRADSARAQQKPSPPVAPFQATNNIVELPSGLPGSAALSALMAAAASVNDTQSRRSSPAATTADPLSSPVDAAPPARSTSSPPRSAMSSPALFQRGIKRKPLSYASSDGGVMIKRSKTGDRDEWHEEDEGSKIGDAGLVKRGKGADGVMVQTTDIPTNS